MEPEHAWGMKTIALEEMFVYVGTCTCGWKSPRMKTRDAAAALSTSPTP